MIDLLLTQLANCYSLISFNGFLNTENILFIL